MKRFSWHSEPGLAPHWYKIYGWLPNRYAPIVMFDSLPIYKPNRKGGHRHNHVRNAMARMRKCKECGDSIVKGMEARIEMPLVRGRDDTMCRCCLRMLDEEIYHHNYQTVKEIEMMEADL